MADESQAEAANEAEAALLEWLRTSKGVASVWMVGKDGKRRKLQLRTGGNRWVVCARTIMRAIDDIDRIETEDKRGGVVDMWNVPEPVDHEAEAIEARKREDQEAESKAPREMKALAVLGRMLQDAADHAVDRQHKHTKELLGFVMEGNKQTQQRLETLERSMTGMLKTVFEAHRMRAQVEGFIAGGGLKGQDEPPQNPGDQLMVALLAQKLGVTLPAQPQALAGNAAPTDGGEGGEGF